MPANEQSAPHPLAAFTTAPRASADRALDWLNFSVANIQTGFGPFIVVYLTSHGWTQAAIGIALSIGTLTAMASQIPAGALVDAVRRKSRAAAVSIVAFTVSALLLASSPTPLSVYCAEILHGFSSCTLGPAIAAMSLALAGRLHLERRLALNARYASIGNGVGAALMGATSYLLSDRAVFVVTAALTLPALLALVPLASCDDELPAERRASGPAGEPIGRIIADRRFLTFALLASLFTLGNAAMLPLASSELTSRAAATGSLFIAACIVLPQGLLALLSPAIGRLAARRGRRILALLCLGSLVLRGILFALLREPAAMVAIQALDGIAGASFAIMVPLVISDMAGRSGHYTLCLGIVGFAIGLGATASTALAGLIADRFGSSAAFLTLAAIGMLGLLLAILAMPETRLRLPLVSASCP